jgi:hypothetical protein
MDLAQCNFWKDVVPVVKKMGNSAFSRRNKREKMADAISEAWVQFESAPPNATPVSIAYYAVLRVNHGRQFKQSVRSITGPNPLGAAKDTRCEFNQYLLLDRRLNPADAVVVLIDFPGWFATLTKRQQTICMAALMGDTTREIAERLKVSPPAVSQVRRKLVELWQSYTE